VSSVKWGKPFLLPIA